MPEAQVDPYVARLASMTGKSIDQIMVDDTPKNIEAEIPLTLIAAGDGRPKDSTSTGAVAPVAPSKEQAEADAKAKEEEEKKKQEAEAKAKAEAEAAAKSKPNESTTPPVNVVVRKKEEPKKEEPNPEVDEKKRKDEEYINGLTEAQREEIELARYAESNGKPGAVEKLLEYYRKADKFIDDNPEEEPDGEKFKEFEKENNPKWITPAERRKLERKMITDEVVRVTREEVRKEYEPVVRDFQEMKLKPVVDAAAQKTSEIMLGEDGFDKDVVAKVSGMKYSEAAELHPIEAPIIVGTMAATREYAKIWNGLVAVNPANQLHSYLFTFADNVQRDILSKPEAERVRNGKKFLKIEDFSKLHSENPAAAAERYYTVDADLMAERLALNAKQQFKMQLQRLEKSGFSRAKPAAAAAKSDNTEVPPKKEDDLGGPRATSHIMPGAAQDAGSNNKDLPAHLRWVNQK
jgi:hypothetical protein